MKKIVYLIRHSKALKLNNEFNYESLQIQNEKYTLSIEGEELAKERLVNEELTNLDLIVSSNYCRAIGTAKYLTIKNDKEIVVLPNLVKENLVQILMKNYLKIFIKNNI